MAESVDRERSQRKDFGSPPGAASQFGLMRIQDWNQRRKFFNHQVWKNEFVLALENLSRCGAADSIRGEIRSVDHACAAWGKLRIEVASLFETYERDCSPRSFFNIPPLAPVDPQAAEWLPNLVHEDWLARRGVKEWVNAGGEILLEIDDALAEWSSRGTSKEPRDLSGLIAKCKKLGDHLQNFPTRLCCV